VWKRQRIFFIGNVYRFTRLLHLIIEHDRENPTHAITSILYTVFPRLAQIHGPYYRDWSKNKRIHHTLNHTSLQVLMRSILKRSKYWHKEKQRLHSVNFHSFHIVTVERFMMGEKWRLIISIINGLQKNVLCCDFGIENKDCINCHVHALFKTWNLPTNHFLVTSNSYQKDLLFDVSIQQSKVYSCILQFV